MKRPHRHASEWQTLISQWQASGLSASAFCGQHNIGYASFCQWRQRLRPADGMEEPAVPANTFIDWGAVMSHGIIFPQGATHSSKHGLSLKASYPPMVTRQSVHETAS